MSVPLVAAAAFVVRTAGASPPPPDGDGETAEVLVVGDALRDPVAAKDPNVAGTVVPRDRLVAPGLEAQDVLRTQPGVVVTESGGFGAPATAAIRGATAADTPVYLAGVRLNDDVGGTADLSLVPLWLVDRIEVYRGNAPVEADRLGAGGAIFFEPRMPGRSGGGVGYWGGSWGASKGWAYQGVHEGPVSALVGVSGDRATNRYPFLNDRGELFEPGVATPAVRENADEATTEGWGLAHVDLGGGAGVDVLLNGIVREQGVPSLALFPTRKAREHSDRTLGSVKAHVPVGGGDVSAIDAQTSVLVGRTSFDDPLLELDLLTPRLVIVGMRVEQSLSATVAATDWLLVRPRVDVAHEGIERTPDNIPLGRARREFGRAAVGASARLAPWLEAHALANGECHDTGVDPARTCDVLEPTGRVGVDVGGRRLHVLANAGRYVRVPTLAEVYGASGTIHGNPALAPESGYTADVGLRAQTGRGAIVYGAYVDAFVFGHWVDKLVAYERTGEGFLTPYNVGRAQVLGAELLAGVSPVKGIRAEVTATLLDPRDTTPSRIAVNDVLPFRSRFVGGPRVRADWKLASRSALSTVGGELGALYQSSRYADSGGLGVIPEQTSVDVEADAAWYGGRLVARLRVADLFDSTRTDVIGYPLPGRSAYFGMEASW
jgi:iron complex outermembrane receptor protein